MGEPTIIAIVLQLTFSVIVIMGLGKLQGKAFTHFEKVVWWKSFMVDLVMCKHIYNVFSHKNVYTFHNPP